MLPQITKTVKVILEDCGSQTSSAMCEANKDRSNSNAKQMELLSKMCAEREKRKRIPHSEWSVSCLQLNEMGPPCKNENEWKKAYNNLCYRMKTAPHQNENTIAEELNIDHPLLKVSSIAEADCCTELEYLDQKGGESSQLGNHSLARSQETSYAEDDVSTEIDYYVVSTQQTPLGKPQVYILNYLNVSFI